MLRNVVLTEIASPLLTDFAFTLSLSCIETKCFTPLCCRIMFYMHKDMLAA